LEPCPCLWLLYHICRTHTRDSSLTRLCSIASMASRDRIP
jgi:hypothetical protein